MAQEDNSSGIALPGAAIAVAAGVYIYVGQEGLIKALLWFGWLVLTAMSFCAAIAVMMARADAAGAVPAKGDEDGLISTVTAIGTVVFLIILVFPTLIPWVWGISGVWIVASLLFIH